MSDWSEDHYALNYDAVLRRANQERAEALRYGLHAVAGKIRSGLRSFASLFSKFQKWRIQRRTVSELSALDDHLLGDIGLQRGEILQVSRALGTEVRSLAGIRKSEALAVKPKLLVEHVEAETRSRSAAGFSDGAEEPRLAA